MLAPLSRQDLDQWLIDLVKELLDRTGLDNDDERLVMTIRKERLTLPVTINQRYVIEGAPSGQIGLIMPLEYDLAVNKVKERIIQDNEDYFTSDGIKDALWVVFDRKEGVYLSPEIKELWLEAVPPRAGGGGEIGLPQASPPDPL